MRTCMMFIRGIRWRRVFEGGRIGMTLSEGMVDLRKTWPFYLCGRVYGRLRNHACMHAILNTYSRRVQGLSSDTQIVHTMTQCHI